MNDATVGRLLERATRRLRPLGSGAPDARRLLTFVTGWSGAALVVHRDDVVDDEDRAAFDAAVARRACGEPIAYIVGSAGFYGRSFTVTRDVLVPRPESEHIVEAAVAELLSRPCERRRVADIGTGSGVLAITLAAEIADAVVAATDASPHALAIARANAKSLELHKRVAFFEGDLAAPLATFAPIDVVIANLPYVPTRDVPPSPDPVSFEPHIAIDGGPDGLDLYRRLIVQLPPLLAAGAALFFEAAPPTIEALAALVAAGFPNAHVEIGEDYAGLERYVAAHLPPNVAERAR